MLNVILTIPMILDRLPVRLGEKEDCLYERYFRGFMPKKQFKLLMTCGQIVNHHTPAELCAKGDLLTHFILLGSVPLGSEVNFVKDGLVVDSLGEGYWVGVVDEYAALVRVGKDEEESGDDEEEKEGEEQRADGGPLKWTGD